MYYKCANTGIITSLIGVFSALSGTVLGWMLNTLSKKGKLNVFITSCNDFFSKPDRYGGFEHCMSKDEVDRYSFELSLDLYNSSEITKIMRDVAIEFSQEKINLFSVVPYNRDIKKNIEPQNIAPKVVVKLNLSVGLDRNAVEFKSIWNAKEIHLVYYDEKSKKRVIQIKDVDYEHYFDNSANGTKA